MSHAPSLSTNVEEQTFSVIDASRLITSNAQLVLINTLTECLHISWDNSNAFTFIYCMWNREKARGPISFSLAIRVRLASPKSLFSSSDSLWMISPSHVTLAGLSAINVTTGTADIKNAEFETINIQKHKDGKVEDAFGTVVHFKGFQTPSFGATVDCQSNLCLEGTK